VAQQVVREDSPYRRAIRGIAHAVGLRVVASRSFSGMSDTIGVWYWVAETEKAIQKLKEQRQWDYPQGVPDASTIKRRINYLADPKWLDEGVPRPQDEPPLWDHLALEYFDVDPMMSTTRKQSSYRPRWIQP